MCYLWKKLRDLRSVKSKGMKLQILWTFVNTTYTKFGSLRLPFCWVIKTEIPVQVMLEGDNENTLSFLFASFVRLFDAVRALRIHALLPYRGDVNHCHQKKKKCGCFFLLLLLFSFFDGQISRRITPNLRKYRGDIEALRCCAILWEDNNANLRQWWRN